MNRALVAGDQVQAKRSRRAAKLEDDRDAALGRVDETGHTLAEGLQPRLWGLRDFRIVDPDGYCVRAITGLPEPPAHG